MTSPITVKRSDIQLAEEEFYTLTGETTISWSAALFGHLSTGEHIDMTRTGSDYREALKNLEKAVAANGWEWTA